MFSNFKIIIMMIAIMNIAAAQKQTSNVNWNLINPTDTNPRYTSPVKFKLTKIFLKEKGKYRRDPSDIIKIYDTYYVYYTYLEEGMPGYPEGWGGSIYCASSKDGINWQEQGEVIDRAKGEKWDATGCYTPNVIHYNNKIYLAYTAMPKPFIRATSKASIGLATASNPLGPFNKYKNNPIIKPSSNLKNIDSFLVDDAVFVIKNNQFMIYHKAFPAIVNHKGQIVRNGHNTFMMRTVATSPKGPFTQIPQPLTRAHEVIVWNYKDSVESMTIGWGKFLFYQSKNGVNFKAIYPLSLKKEYFGLRAAGFYRKDLTDNHSSNTRPSWGICMAQGGLARFEIIWPKNQLKFYE